jgi:hypothetical protein
MDAKADVGKGRVAASVGSADVHQHSRNTIAYKDQIRQKKRKRRPHNEKKAQSGKEKGTRLALEAAMEVILVRLVLLTRLIANKIEVLAVLFGEVRPVRNAALDILSTSKISSRREESEETTREQKKIIHKIIKKR